MLIIKKKYLYMFPLWLRLCLSREVVSMLCANTYTPYVYSRYSSIKHPRFVALLIVFRRTLLLNHCCTRVVD